MCSRCSPTQPTTTNALQMVPSDWTTELVSLLVITPKTINAQNTNLQRSGWFQSLFKSVIADPEQVDNRDIAVLTSRLVNGAYVHSITVGFSCATSVWLAGCALLE